MCGIIGYTGHRPACEVLLEGLGRLEYRGYDSAGVLVEHQGRFSCVKRAGRLENLRALLEAHPLEGSCGIGHTRWATHGGPTDANSHPHGTERVMLVHNGIIENYLSLKAFLIEKGYAFTSETDSEIAACYLDFCYDGDPVSSIARALKGIEGAYAFVIMFAEHPGVLYAVRKDGPLLAALGEGENLLVSDVTAAVGYTRRFLTLNEGEIAIATPEEVCVVDTAGNPVEKVPMVVDWDVSQAQKGGYPHFMLKEIHEQPEALLQTIRPRVHDGLPCFDCDGLPPDFFASFSRIHIVACGTAMHAGLVGRSVIERLARIPVEVDIASEFRYREPILEKDSLVIIISQSGETADSLAALRLARSMGVTTLAIVNVAGSSIAREADHVIFTYAGPEISVASTKAYSVQLAILYLIAFELGLRQNALSQEEARRLTRQLEQVRGTVAGIIERFDEIDSAAAAFENAHSVFFLGRGADWALASEGSLKLKEISYIHCEAYAAGELKHGTISLITDGTPVIALATQKALFPKMLSNIREVRARGAAVLLIADTDEETANGCSDRLIRLEPLDDLFMTFPAAAVLQLIAYCTARRRGCDIDKPRNLAKSVTVE